MGDACGRINGFDNGAGNNCAGLVSHNTVDSTAKCLSVHGKRDGDDRSKDQEQSCEYTSGNPMKHCAYPPESVQIIFVVRPNLRDQVRIWVVRDTCRRYVSFGIDKAGKCGCNCPFSTVGSSESGINKDSQFFSALGCVQAAELPH